MLGIEIGDAPMGILAATWDNKLHYAQHHGYSIYNGTSSVDRNRPHAWSKMAVVLDMLRVGSTPSTPGFNLLQQSSSNSPRIALNISKHLTYDWVLYLDADTLVTNSDVSIEGIIPDSSGGDMVLSQDMYGVNTGVWLVRNTDWSKGLLREWSSMQTFVLVCAHSLPLAFYSHVCSALVRKFVFTQWTETLFPPPYRLRRVFILLHLEVARDFIVARLQPQSA